MCTPWGLLPISWGTQPWSFEGSPLGLETLRYATVAVNAPVGRPGLPREGRDRGDTFHYLIPEALRGTVRPGHMVWVPFGGRRLDGIVTGFASSTPPVEAREIEGLISEEAVVTPLQIALAEWIAREYLAPLGRVLKMMLPPGAGATSEVLVEVVAEGPPEELALSPTQQAVFRALKGRGPVPLARVANLARVAGWRSALSALVDKGLVSQHAGRRTPTARPKTERFVRLAPGAGEAEATLSGAPRQLALYRYLAGEARSGAALPVSRVLAETGASRASLEALAARGLVEIAEVEVWRDPLAGREFVLAEEPRLTPDQEGVLDQIIPVLEARRHHTFLLHGVTGSGKTEIYLRAAARVLAQGRGVIFLVPEISLTPQTVRRVAARFPGRVAVWHSQLSEGQRYDQWRRVMQGQAAVVVGPRSAILAPMADPGLIVVDEEHEPSYKQETAPRYHAREAAVALGSLCGACVILGSATPDVVSMHRAASGVYTRLSLPKRVLSHRRHIEEQRAQHRLPVRPLRPQPLAEGNEDLLYVPLPPVEVVDLRRELREGNRSIFSRALQAAMAEALAAREQVILFLNRRGSATFVLCRDCGHTLICPRCDVSLSYHGAEQELVCHHCYHREPQPRVCPRCLSRRIRYFGIGTQRVVEEVRALFPEARVVRWDRDATRTRGSHEELLRQFVEHEADVMVGTQMIAKGLDLPLVTLVGVVSADTALHLPDYRAAERTFQLLTQVAGRAGRSPLGGRVIVQTYTPEHYAIRAAGRHDYEGFVRQELSFRQRHGYPPFARLVRLLYADEDAARARQRATELAGALVERIRALGIPGVEMIGPAPCPHARLHGRWRWHVILRALDPHRVLDGLPVPRGWRIDVDPASFG